MRDDHQGPACPAQAALFPTTVTHIYDPDRGPFRNLCALPDAEAEEILAAIRASGRRQVRSVYLVRRRAAEAWLADECRRLLGDRPRRHPIYFFLGDFDDGKDPSRRSAIILPLASLPADALTFTYGDSMTVHRDRDRGAKDGGAFTLDEIRRFVAAAGLPTGGFIEVQLWDDAGLRPSRP